MIIIKLKGGLGNQLFQYAYGRLLCVKNGVAVKYYFEGNAKTDTHRNYKLEYFHTKIALATFEEVQNIRYPHGIFSKITDLLNKKIFRQYNIGYVPSALKKTHGFSEGFWQSYKYLEPIKKELYAEITLKNPITEKFPEIIRQMAETNSVSVHIRRGDYVNNAKTKSEHYCFGLEYYIAAIKIMRAKIQNPTFFIFSDDILWAKENLKTDEKMIFVSSPEIQDYEELILMSNCKNNIIANSSFSFWAAWLNKNQNKVVIAPKKWNNRYQNKYKDLLPENWITI